MQNRPAAAIELVEHVAYRSATGDAWTLDLAFYTQLGFLRKFDNSFYVKL
jgi:hypothetical protein